ncbi:hypothetical protein AB0759_00965 [Scytonema tolypothrichoides VB-61278_2]|uniref:Uncharacterized protein n=1 Tax=Scytonema tolypothrichoides VB-61278_2 TaxID=3232314 RepID=A0ABW8WE01_9CYAN
MYNSVLGDRSTPTRAIALGASRKSAYRAFEASLLQGATVAILQGLSKIVAKDKHLCTGEEKTA